MLVSSAAIRNKRLGIVERDSAAIAWRYETRYANLGYDRPAKGARAGGRVEAKDRQTPAFVQEGLPELPGFECRHRRLAPPPNMTFPAEGNLRN
jgi:hypothetical protein